MLLATAKASAETPREAAIRGVISEQIEAFRRDDAAAAFAIASPMIQQLFGDPVNFMAMVVTGYPQVYRPRSLRFLALSDAGGRLLQKVLIEGPDGALVVAQYEMIEIDGRWRINGCTLVKGDDT
jgi:hypothetical protein